MPCSEERPSQPDGIPYGCITSRNGIWFWRVGPRGGYSSSFDEVLAAVRRAVGDTANQARPEAAEATTLSDLD